MKCEVGAEWLKNFHGCETPWRSMIVAENCGKSGNMKNSFLV
ncbi:MAG: hypothetical protein ACKD6N_07055 [Candidatus Bathyarchaeota archaeon]